MCSSLKQLSVELGAGIFPPVQAGAEQQHNEVIRPGPGGCTKDVIRTSQANTNILLLSLLLPLQASKPTLLKSHGCNSLM